MATLREILIEKLEIVENATKKLRDAIKQVEEDIFNEISTYILSLGTENGALENTDTNVEALLDITSDISSIVNGSELTQQVTNIVSEDVGRIEELTADYFDQDNNGVENVRDFLASNRDVDEELHIAEVISGVTEEAIINQQLVAPIREALFDSIVNGDSISQATKKIRNIIVSIDGVDSTILKYVGQISRDTLNQYEGSRQDRIRIEYGLDGFFFIGSQIPTTRPWCCAMLYRNDVPLKSPSAAAVCATLKETINPLHLGRGKYKVSDIPTFIELGNGTSGFNDKVSINTFARYRGGYNCRHLIQYIKL